MSSKIVQEHKFDFIGSFIRVFSVFWPIQKWINILQRSPWLIWIIFYIYKLTIHWKFFA